MSARHRSNARRLAEPPPRAILRRVGPDRVRVELIDRTALVRRRCLARDPITAAEREAERRWWSDWKARLAQALANSPV